MNYLLSASLVLLLAWPACHLLLRYTNRYALNRWLLLFAFGVVALLPLVPLESPAPAATEVVAGTIDYVITDYVAPSASASALTVQPTTTPLPAAASSHEVSPAVGTYFSWDKAYLAGLAFFLLVLVTRLAFLLTLHLRSRPNGDAQYRLLHPDAKPGQAFTFGRNVYFSIDVPDGADFEHILAHGKIHAQQGHSTDILLSELFLCVFWFHPVAWWLRNKLRANLEYLVDNEVVNRGTSRREYQLALVRQSQIAHNLALALPFSEPTLKGRISRMTGLPQHRVVAVMATLAMLLWVGIAGMVVYGTTTSPVYTGEEPFVAYYKDKVPEEIISFNIYAKRAPTTDEYYQLRAILKHIPETELYLYKNPFDDGLTMRLDHWQNRPVTLKWLSSESDPERPYRMGLMPRLAPFANLTEPLPTGGYFVPVTEDTDQSNLIIPMTGGTFVTQSYGYEPSGLDLQNFEFAEGEEFVVTINGKRFPLRPAEVVSANDGKYYLFDNGTVAPTQWSIDEYFAPYQPVARTRFKRLLGCMGKQECARSVVSIYGPSPAQAVAWVDKNNPGDYIPLRAYYNDQLVDLQTLLSRDYGTNSMLQVGYRTTDSELMKYGYVVQVIDDSPAQIARVVREINQSEE